MTLLKVMRLGMWDGIGALLAIAAFDQDGDGDESERELANFEEKGERLVEAVASGCLNYSVVSSLYLTMYVALIVMNAGGGAYDSDGNDIGPMGVSLYNEESRQFLDLATYAWPNDAANTRRTALALTASREDQGMIFEIGSSTMSVAPLSRSCGIKMLISSLGTTVSTA